MFATKTVESFFETFELDNQELGLLFVADCQIEVQIESGERETLYNPPSGPTIEVLSIRVESCEAYGIHSHKRFCEAPKPIVLEIADRVEGWEIDGTIWDHLGEDYSSCRD